MSVLYLLCAALGGTLLVCQFGLALLGFGGDQDAGTDGAVGLDEDFGTETLLEPDLEAEGDAGNETATSGFLGLLTFRTVTAALAFFGLAGLAARAGGWNEFQSALTAAAFGGLAFWAVHQLMRGISQLRSDGTVHIREAVGCNGTVYLRIPEPAHGLGKVHVVLREQTVELSAQSAQGEIPTGQPVQVVRVLGPDLVEVAPS